MARPLRIQYPGAWYHLTCRGNEGRSIFGADADRCRFLAILAQSAAIYQVEIHAYVLMSDHFHLVVHTPQANLNRFMQRFNTTYTVYFNRRHDCRGQLYQGRYKALLVDADRYLLELSRYLHLNPLRVSPTSALNRAEKRQVLQTYRWSSFGGYTHLRRCPEFLCCQKVLFMLGSGDAAARREDYRRFVQKGIETPWAFNLKEKVRARAVLGSDDFLDGMRGRFPAGGPLPAGSLPTRLESPQEIAARLAPVLAVTVESLLQPRSRQREARSIFLELCRVHLARGRTMSSAAAAMGIGVSALSHNHRRLGKRMTADPLFRQRFVQASEVIEYGEWLWFDPKMPN